MFEGLRVFMMSSCSGMLAAVEHVKQLGSVSRAVHSELLGFEPFHQK